MITHNAYEFLLINSFLLFSYIPLENLLHAFSWLLVDIRYQIIFQTKFIAESGEATCSVIFLKNTPCQLNVDITYQHIKPVVWKAFLMGYRQVEEKVPNRENASLSKNQICAENFEANQSPAPVVSVKSNLHPLCLASSEPGLPPRSAKDIITTN